MSSLKELIPELGEALGEGADEGGGGHPRHSGREVEQVQRFIKSLNQALVSNGFSQRDLCHELGISIGTMTKYLRGAVPPLRVGTGIQCRLARQLGVTLDALVSYYESGQYVTNVSVDDVASWIRSDAGQRDLPRIMASLEDAGKRWLIGCDTCNTRDSPSQPKRYDWPKEELDRLEIPEKVRQRLGLTDEALERLATKGEYDQEMVECFAALIGLPPERVERAFKDRELIPE